MIENSVYNLGVDLGGTQIKFGIVDSAGNIINALSVPTPANVASIASTIAESLIKLVEESGLSFDNIKGLGVGCPGIIDRKEGIISRLTNLNMQNFDFASAIRVNLIRKKAVRDLYVRLINDADAAALAEHRLGAGLGYKNMVMLTIGTGLGGGIIINNELYEGTSAAGEVGHMIISAGGRRCSCGANGCWEAYASMSALISVARTMRSRYKTSLLNRYKKVDGEAVFDSYFMADMAAIKTVHDFVHHLSVGIININNILRPEAIILGGGVSALGDRLLSLIDEEIKSNDSFLLKDMSPIIKHAKFYNDAGVIGAALYGGEKAELAGIKSSD